MGEYLELILVALSAIITGVLIPLIRAKTADEKLATTLKLVEKGVEAAEQLFTARGSGVDKKEHVLDWLYKMHVKGTPEELNELIEAAVYELREGE